MVCGDNVEVNSSMTLSQSPYQNAASWRAALEYDDQNTSIVELKAMSLEVLYWELR